MVTPALRICDSHQHFWSHDGDVFMVDDLRAAIAGCPHDIAATVYIECDEHYRTDGPEHLRPAGETEWVAANADPVTKGIVGHADLRLGDAVVEVLDAHHEAGGDRFKGIRQITAWDPDPSTFRVDPHPGPGLLSDPTARRALAVLDRRALSFDALVYFRQLPEIVDLAQALPNLAIVVDHLGGPIAMGAYRGKRDEVRAEWRARLAELATCPNVAVKVGSIGMPFYGLGWHKRASPPALDEIVETWRDDITACIELLGPDRCMAESNFPVDRMSMSYTTVWDALLAMTDHLSPAERAAVFHDTAARVYRL